MSTAIKAAIAALPFAVVLLLIRLVGGGEAGRWVERVEPHLPGAVAGVDEEDLIVVAGDDATARAAATEVRGFRRALVARYAPLLGRPRIERMVVVIFPDARSLQAYAGERLRADRDAAELLHGYADPVHGAIFLPSQSLGTLRHETVHWLMETARGHSPPYSPWLSEGLAQLFETLDPSADPPAPPRIGDTGRARAREVSRDRELDVDRLLALDDYARFIREDGARNYLDALLLCGFLLESRPKDLARYIDEERRSATGRALAFRGIFDHRAEHFRRELREFLSRLGAG